MQPIRRNKLFAQSMLLVSLLVALINPTSSDAAFVTPCQISTSTTTKTILNLEKGHHHHHHYHHEKQEQEHHHQSPSFIKNTNSDDSTVLVSARQARILLPMTVASAAAATTTITNSPRAAHGLPSSSTSFDTTLQESFSGSLTSSVIALRVAGTMRKRGYFPYNTLLGAVVDPTEELNDTSDSLVRLLQSKLSSNEGGGVYRFAILDTFNGVTSMSANLVASHVPQNGNLFIVVAPHVGISKTGQIGSVERIGCPDPTPCRLPINDSSNKSILSIYDQLIKSIQDQVVVIQQTKEINSIWTQAQEITILGGIIIHRGRGSGQTRGEDYFQPLTMKSYRNGGQTVTQLYDEVFGDLRTPRERV